MRNDRKFQFSATNWAEIARHAFAFAAKQARLAGFAAFAGLALTVAAPVASAVEGRSTGQPLPRYASLKASLVYLRLGPGPEYAIAWELTRRHLPVRIVGEHGAWRRIVLHDGSRGWIHSVMLTGRRYAIADVALATIRRAPDTRARPVATLAPATPMRVRGCGLSWCRVEGMGVAGWAAKAEIWGVGPREILE